MKIVIKTKNIELRREVKEWIEARMSSLEKFPKIFEEKNYYNQFFGKGKPKTEIWLEIGKETRHHQKGPYYFAEIQMRLPKKSLRAVVSSKDWRRAVTEARDKIARQIKKHKESIPHSLTRRRQREMKKTLRIDKGAQFKKGQRTLEEGI